MKYKHYAPKAKVILVKGTAERYREFVNSKKAPGVGALCFDEDQHLLKVPSVPTAAETTAPPRPESCSMLYGNWMNGRKSSWYMPGAGAGGRGHGGL